MMDIYNKLIGKNFNFILLPYNKHSILNEIYMYIICIYSIIFRLTKTKTSKVKKNDMSNNHSIGACLYLKI